MDRVLTRKLEREIADLEEQLACKKAELDRLKNEPPLSESPVSQSASITQDIGNQGINNLSSPEDKIALFRSLFRGREDLYARRFESRKTGKAGYQPVCKNEWVRELCEKPRITCGLCPHRSFEPVTGEVIRNHLAGSTFNNRGAATPFVMGIYPLLQNETCHLLALDFDKQSWQEDVKAFFETCEAEGIPAGIERSRSGNGAHVWIFFTQPISASKARKLGSFLMTRTLDRRPEIGLDSFDRFFPNQDTLPKGGFGNLIALPLQKAARAQNHSLFLEPSMIPYPDQWQYLASIQRVTEDQVDSSIQNALRRNELLPVSFNPLEAGEEEEKPWQRKTEILPVITEPLPHAVEVVAADQIYINHTGLPPILRNRILRLASFSNPEFYRAQAMRLPTWNKPRILCCYEFFPKYIGLPVGCFGGLQEILSHYQIRAEIQDKQNHGNPVAFEFQGELRENQKQAVEKILPYAAGILSASTAFGKTVVALWIIAQRKVNTLVLVHRRQLLDQWVDRINQFLGIPKKEIGCFSGIRKKRTGVIDIAVMQSVVKRDTVVEWIKDYGQIIVDECHHISASSFERIIRKCPAFYRLGLSATIVRKDGQHPIVLMNLGDPCFSYKEHGDTVLFKQIVLPRFTTFSLPEIPGAMPPSIQEIFHQLCGNESRNNLIINDTVAAYTEGRECLVLSERLEHLALLHEALKGKIPHLFILKGGMGKKRLKSVMEEIQAVPASENRIILATGKYLGEGFDLPCLDTLFLIFPFSWKGTLIQYTGRLNRIYHGKKEIRVYDYVDERVQVLFRMYGKRLRGYKSLGFIID
jgi:superfamily II DNA or RNA helicase